MTNHVFLLHGLGSRPITLWPLKKFLEWKGVENIHDLWYSVDKMEFEETLDYVDKEMEAHADKENDTVVLIGQSMGGLVANNMWKKGWNITKSVTIGSPLHGARLIDQVERLYPLVSTVGYTRLYTKRSHTISYDLSNQINPPPLPILVLQWLGCLLISMDV